MPITTQRLVLRPEFAGQGIAQEALRGFALFLFARFAPPAL